VLPPNVTNQYIEIVYWIPAAWNALHSRVAVLLPDWFRVTAVRARMTFKIRGSAPVSGSRKSTGPAR